MKHIDLFSGIGGFSLGFEREGIDTIAFCESDEFCRRVIKGRWTGIPIYGDITDLSGFPVSGSLGCGPQGRTVRLEELADVRPTWVVVENTYHRWRAWVPQLRSHLWAIGYASVCLRVRASEVGARHERARAFVVAHADSEQLRELSRWWSGEGGEVAKELAESWDSAPRGLGADDGISSGAHFRRHALGNAVVPQVAQLIARGINRADSTVNPK